MSALEQHLVDYLQLRRALGHQLATSAWLLPSFVAYLDARNMTTVTIEAALAWSGASHPNMGPRRMTVVRGFARYLSGIDPSTQIPPLGLMPTRQRRRPPFIYTPADIDLIMTAAGTSIRQPLRAATYRTVIGLLAASGLRIGEAITLDRSDIDWDDRVLLIRESKFGKSRLVPLQSSTMAALADYTVVRDELAPRPEGPSFFVSLTRRRLCYEAVAVTFRTLVDDSGVGMQAPYAPRLHDLRHTFTVSTLLGWYRTGQDVQAKLPWLSTYLGHREPASTYWYLSAVPELLGLAAARQHAAWSAVRA